MLPSAIFTALKKGIMIEGSVLYFLWGKDKEKLRLNTKNYFP
jgi:hypothetical protein